MTFTDFGRQAVAWRLGSALDSLFIQYVGIGTGSAEVLVTDATLVSEQNRTLITGSPDFTENFKVGFQADFNSSQMSGLELTEYSLTHVASGTGFAGSIWQREGFGSILFDGTNELQILSTLEVIQSGTS